MNIKTQCFKGGPNENKVYLLALC